MTADPDAVADLVLGQFKRLPAKRKPQVRDNGLHEWVPLGGIVAEQDGVLTCLSLATGMKCLPAAKLPLANGNALHDWHAEVLAIRAFNRFILDECHRQLQESNPASAADAASPKRPPLLRRREPHELSPESPQPFAIRDDVKLHMYCSEAPCGDASMELTMAAQEDASPWELPPATASTIPPDDNPLATATANANETSTAAASLPGRAYFSQLGVVRRKPARRDAPPTASKSCSDKLALKQCTSLLSSLASLLVHPGNAYAATLVLPESQYSAAGCARSFSADGRMGAVLLGRRLREWRGGYRFAPFEVRTTVREFGFSKRSVVGGNAGGGGAAAAAAAAATSSNLAAVWTCDGGVEEGTMGGVLQGRRGFEVRGASAVSRRRMWDAAAAVAGELGEGEGEGRWEVLRRALGAETYALVKGGELLAARREVKRDVRDVALAGWVVNVGDDDFGLQSG